jgi:hypothetical protein
MEYTAQAIGESDYWFSVPYEIHSTASLKCWKYIFSQSKFYLPQEHQIICYIVSRIQEYNDTFIIFGGHWLSGGKWSTQKKPWPFVIYQQFLSNIKYTSQQKGSKTLKLDKISTNYIIRTLTKINALAWVVVLVFLEIWLKFTKINMNVQNGYLHLIFQFHLTSNLNEY